MDIVYDAPEYAERDRSPVMILMDGCLGTMMEEVELPPMKELPESCLLYTSLLQIKHAVSGRCNQVHVVGNQQQAFSRCGKLPEQLYRQAHICLLYTSRCV